MHAAASSASVRDDLKLAAVFGAAAAIATALLFPYLLQLMPQAFEKIPLPLAAVIPLQSLQAGLLFSLMAFVGLRLAPRARLGAPWLRAWMQGQPKPPLAWKTAIASGLLAGLAIVAFAALLDPHLPARLPTGSSPPAATADAFNGFLASFYGGIGEAISKKIADLLTTGTFNAYEKAKAAIPETTLDLLKVDGIGIKTLKLLYDQFCLTNLDDFAKFVAGGGLDSVSGMGEKTQMRIQKSLAELGKFAG